MVMKWGVGSLKHIQGAFAASLHPCSDVRFSGPCPDAPWRAALEGVGGRHKDCPEHHWCLKGHSNVLAPGLRTEPAPAAHCSPHQATQIQTKYLRCWRVPSWAIALQGIGQYPWVSFGILIRKSLFSYCNDWQNPTKWCWNHLSFQHNILRKAALQKKPLFIVKYPYLFRIS